VVFPSSAYDIGRHAQHWHGGDDWEDMEEVTQDRDAAAVDPERGWSARIFRCTACNEQFRITDASAPPSGQQP
jgi:hypothetical protein